MTPTPMTPTPMIPTTPTPRGDRGTTDTGQIGDDRG
jgi:hypothetical protein